MTPPSLAWLTSFCSSTGAALDQRMVADTKATVNALVYTVSVSWGEQISTKSALMVWNLFQKWAAKNQTTPSGRVNFEEHQVLGETKVVGFSVDVHLRERLGHPRDGHP